VSAGQTAKVGEVSSRPRKGQLQRLIVEAYNFAAVESEGTFATHKINEEFGGDNSHQPTLDLFPDFSN
jgi:hypothetical protein